jgi:hypothetical protein
LLFLVFRCSSYFVDIHCALLLLHASLLFLFHCYSSCFALLLLLHSSSSCFTTTRRVLLLLLLCYCFVFCHSSMLHCSTTLPGTFLPLVVSLFLHAWLLPCPD